jgi:hypothetical protein
MHRHGGGGASPLFSGIWRFGLTRVAVLTNQA